MNYSIQVICLLWATFFVPYTLSVWIRCIVHNLRYSVSTFDFMTATSIVALYLLGLPKFPGI